MRLARILSGCLLACACAAGCSGADFSRPTFPAQGGDGSLLPANPAVLVDPDDRNVWLPHDGTLLAVSTSSGALTSVYPLAGFSSLRIAFLEGDVALLLAEGGSCPFETDVCTTVIRVHTATFEAEVIAYEGSQFAGGVVSPLNDLVALSGGLFGNGIFVVGADREPQTLDWSAYPGGIGWSRCPEVEGCDERLWVVGAAGARSWRVTGGEIAAQPDVSFEFACGNGGSLFGGVGSLVAASPDGRFVALSCPGGDFVLYDAITKSVRPTIHNGPVLFAGRIVVSHGWGDFDGDQEDDESRACLVLVDAFDLSTRYDCINDEWFDYFVSDDEQHVLLSTNAGNLAVVDVAGIGGDEVWIGDGGNTVSLRAGEFIERPGAGQIWQAEAGRLVRIDFVEGASFPPLPFAVDHLNVIRSQDRLALLSSDASLVFYSMTGESVDLVVPLP